MTHRTDIEWIDISKSQDELKNQLLKTSYSRIICGMGNLDNFVGVLHLRDFYKAIALGSSFDIGGLITEPIIIPDSTDAKKILELFRDNQTHVCCVVNEYGGFEGIITPHDLLESIVGQIPNEGEKYEPSVFVRSDHSYLVNGEAPIETLTSIIENFDVDFETIDYTTVAGFVMNRLKKIPELGDRFESLGYTFEVVDIDGNRTDKVLISKTKV